MRNSTRTVIIVSVLALVAFLLMLMNAQEAEGVLPFAFLVFVVAAEIISRKVLRRKQWPFWAKIADFLLLIVVGALLTWWML